MQTLGADRFRLSHRYVKGIVWILSWDLLDYIIRNLFFDSTYRGKFLTSQWDFFAIFGTVFLYFCFVIGGSYFALKSRIDLETFINVTRAIKY
jgi:hypothetical protein